MVDPSVYQLAQQVIQREGGYVEHPNDPGGATKYGISLAFARRIGLDLDGDGDTDKEDIKAITVEIARDLLVAHFFEGPGLDSLPPELHDVMFDTSVLFGPADAVRMLQTCLVKAGITVDVDGFLGPQTLTAVDRVAAAGGLKLLREAILVERAREHRWRVAHNPKLKPFLRGWLNRAARLARDERTLAQIYEEGRG